MFLRQAASGFRNILLGSEIRVEQGQFHLDTDLAYCWRAFLDAEIGEILVYGDIAARARLLPGLHGDSADRLIVPTVLVGYQLVTSDRRILDWSDTRHRLDATN